jgi:hypothetical protein
MSDVILVLEETASQSLGTGLADIGDSFTYKVTVDLPHIATATDLKMEIFAIDPVSGVGAFTICHTVQESLGTGITASGDPAITETIKSDYASVVSVLNIFFLIFFCANC